MEEDQFDVHDILPNTVPDPASLTLESDYACPAGEMVMAPDCGKTILFFNIDWFLKKNDKLKEKLNPIYFIF